MFSISSIGKLQKITKLFTLFYNPQNEGLLFEIFAQKAIKTRLVLFLILLHFDILVNTLHIKIFLYFLNCNKIEVANAPAGQYTGYNSP